VQEYILLQSLLGIWPIGLAEPDIEALRTRLGEYAIKAAREAKEDTSWLDPDEAAEAGLRDLVATMLPEQGAGGFERYFRAMLDPVAFFGMLNTLSAVTLKLTAPGIPDLYQGTELPALALVDPDNRRPVDLDAHAAVLADLDARVASESLATVAAQLLAGWQDGKLKLLLTSRLLRLRRTHAAALAGDYLALAVQGVRNDHLCAYARTAEATAVITVVTRWSAILSAGALRAPLGEQVWQDTTVLLPPKIPPGRYIDVLSGRTHDIGTGADAAVLQAGALLQTLPCCVLARLEDVR